MSEQNSDVDVIVEYDNHFISNVRIESEKPVKATNEFPAGTDNEKNQKQRSCFVRAWSILVKFSFFVGVICSLPIAYAFPSLGAEYLQPQITATWIAVVFVFLLAGLGIKSGEFSKSFQRIWFNLFVQSFNFFAVSSIVYGISRFLIVTNAVSKGNSLCVFIKNKLLGKRLLFLKKIQCNLFFRPHFIIFLIISFSLHILTKLWVTAWSYVRVFQ